MAEPALSGIVYGVTEVHCSDRARLIEVMEDDYDYLLGKGGFLAGRLVESKQDADRYFHLTEWASEEAFARARSDPRVLEILAGLPAETRFDSAICAPVLVADGRDVGGVRRL